MSLGLRTNCCLLVTGYIMKTVVINVRLLILGHVF